MNYLSIDYGEKRIGLAKGDDRLKIATPFKTIINGPGLLNELAYVVKTEVIEKIVVGVPVSFDGRKNDFADKITEFAEDVEARTDTPVETVNEIFSSKMAAENSQKIDESSAALILQTYLDKLS
ncbi:MAG: Holliday junction resolvase RuvX [Parcubacteria group bacterium]|nr:Holliday junction resolvase RuvX [Parcubacteria group bacterium]